MPRLCSGRNSRKTTDNELKEAFQDQELPMLLLQMKLS